MNVGILAFQGDVSEHRDVLHKLNVEIVEVRSVQDMEKVSHVIIPGGESTVIARFLKDSGVGDLIIKRAKEGSLAVFGTCAGAIVISNEVTGKNAPDPLKLIDITIDRNAYGTQKDSFIAELDVTAIEKRISVAFIRAPRITRVGSAVEIISKYQGEAVIVRSGRIMASTCHPEVCGEEGIHRMFLGM